MHSLRSVLIIRSVNIWTCEVMQQQHGFLWPKSATHISTTSSNFDLFYVIRSLAKQVSEER